MGAENVKENFIFQNAVNLKLTDRGRKKLHVYHLLHKITKFHLNQRWAYHLLH
jgi:hypothetical protein